MEDTQFSNNETIIIGASGLARELVSWIEISEQRTKYNIIGFLDDNIKALFGFNSPIAIIGQINFNLIKKNQKILFAIADCAIKEKLYLNAKNKNINISNYFHETCLLGLRTKVGIGTIIFPRAIISCDVICGNLVFINCGSQIGHDVKIGDFSSIMANVDIGGGAQIGNNVLIGSNAVILPEVKIPNNTVIGAGSVVIKSIKTEGSYFGNPAKRIF